MPQRVNSQSDIGTSKVSSDSYDVDNIFLTDQGWVYRHWKGDPNAILEDGEPAIRYWDEIIVAGEVITPATTGDPVIDNGAVEVTNYDSGSVDAEGAPILGGNQPYPNPLTDGEFETAVGDGKFDVEYADGVADDAAVGSGRYPDFTTGEGEGEAGTPGTPPAGGGGDDDDGVAPVTTGPVSVSGFYPLYTTSDAADAHTGGDGTSHSHQLSGSTYYMPNGLDLGTTMFHGTYGASNY